MIGLGIIGLSSTSCQNELKLPVNPGTDSTINLVHSPDVVAWSGGESLGNTFEVTARNLPMAYSNIGDGDLNNRPQWNNYGAESLVIITDDEREAVLEAIDEKTNGKRISEDLVFPWTSYFLQDVISGQNGNYGGAGSDGTSSSSYTMEAYNKGAVCDPDGQYNEWNRHHYFTGEWDNSINGFPINPNYEDEHVNYEVVSNSAHLNNYYLKGEEKERINETTLMVDMIPGTYDEMRGRQFRWYINCHENLHWSEYIIVKVEGSYYICFDFGCGFPENNVDGNPGKGAEYNDWDYNDWILKITPAGDNSEVWGEEEITPTPPVQPENPADEVEEYPHNNEVEVNYAILDSHERKDGRTDIADLVTKLSIHVRKATDVTITIPIPLEYVVESDDLYIFDKHYVDGSSFGLVDNRPNIITYNIAGEIITLSVSFEEENIVVNITGITQEVIDYCWENNKDGVNFEIYNYFQTEKWSWVKDDSEKGGHGEVSPTGPSREDLFECMNRATIEFSDSPEYYINAFGWNDEKNDAHPNHATVTPISEEYNDPIRGDHLNGTPHNDIYVLDGVESDDIHN